MDTEATLLCYNKGCGQRFHQAKNSSESCTHHPGIPVFHDASKGWSCCNKKTTDFTDFLNIKGCSKSYHSDVKPPEPEKKPEIIIEPENMTETRAPIQTKFMERPSILQTLERIKFTVTGSLTKELQKLKSKVRDNDATIHNPVVTPGTSCKNGGCRDTYEDESDNFETCMHHPGIPVFHEGMKFWTCCTRRTTDFDSFLDQAGCTVGKHLWMKVKSTDNKQSCRYDWYQTGPDVYVSIYSKIPFPEKSIVEANQVKLHVLLVFGEEEEIFELDRPLFGIVDVGQSSVQFAASKVEIKLKKAEAMQWATLFYPETSNSAEGLDETMNDSLSLN